MCKKIRNFLFGKSCNEEMMESIKKREILLIEKEKNLSKILTSWIQFLKKDEREDIVKWREQWVDFGVDIDLNDTLPFTVVFHRNTFAVGTELLRGELIIRDNAVERCILENGEVIPGNFVPVRKLTAREWCKYFNGYSSTQEFIDKMQHIAERYSREGDVVVDARYIMFPDGDNRDIDSNMLFGFRMMTLKQHYSLAALPISPTQILFEKNNLTAPDVEDEHFEYEPIAGDEFEIAE